MVKAFFILFIALLPNHTIAETTRKTQNLVLRPITSPAVNHGIKPKVTFGFHAPTSANSSLTLQYSFSNLANRKSKLRILLNNKPLKTWGLTNLESPQESTVTLGRLKQGYHVVTVQAELENTEDCVQNIENKPSLKILPKTKVFIETDTHSLLGASVEEYLKHFPLDAIEFSVPINSETFSAFLDATTKIPTARGHANGTTLKVSTLPTVEDKAPFQRSENIFSNTPTSVIGHLKAKIGVVEVLLRKNEDITIAVNQLSKKAFRESCQAAGCYITNKLNSHIPTEASAEIKNLRQGLSLKDIGHKHGVQIESNGTQSIKMVWVKPAGVEFKSAPEFHMDFRLPQNRSEMPNQRVSLLLGAMKLDTWTINNAEESLVSLKTKIPQSFLNENAWVFSIVVESEEKNSGQCNSSAPSSVLLKPTTGLVIEPTHEQLTGLAGFFQSAKVKRPLLIGPLPNGWNQIKSLANLLAPLGNATPGQSWNHTHKDQCSQNCISVDDTLYERYNWLSADDLPGMSLQPSKTTHLLQIIESSESQTLKITLGDTRQSPINVPLAFDENLENTAFYSNDKWSMVPIVKRRHRLLDSSTATPLRGNQGSRLKSNKERQLFSINLIWLILALLSAAILFVYRRASFGKSLHFSEIENLNKKERA